MENVTGKNDMEFGSWLTFDGDDEEPKKLITKARKLENTKKITFSFFRAFVFS